MANGLVENIVKQGYLRRINASSNRLSGLFKRNDGNKWFVVTVRNGSPYLEQYDADVDVFSRAPLHSYSLAQCKAVRSMGSSDPPTFCVVCPDKVIELVAASRTQMLDWVSTVESCLSDLGIIKKETVEHVYTVCPAVVRKPRVSKEVLEEREAEALRLAASNEASARPRASAPSLEDQQESIDNTTNRLSSRENERSSIPVEGASTIDTRSKTTARPVIPQESVSDQTSTGASPSTLPIPSFQRRPINPADDLNILPPPLPNRPALTKSSEESFNPYLNITETLEPPVHPVTESSNDSDFVSPEIIAELRKKRLEDASGTYMVMNPLSLPVNEPNSNAVASDDNNKAHCQSPLVQSKATVEAQPDKCDPAPDIDILSLSDSSSCSSSSDPKEMFSIASDNLASEVHENPYTTLPSHSGACALPSNDPPNEPAETYATVSKKSLRSSNDDSSKITKPTPQPRHALIKEASVRNGCQPSFHSNNAATSSKDSSGSPEDLLAAQSLRECKQGDFKDSQEDNLNDLKVADNENFYGLLCDSSVSDSGSSSFIPPLPPRHDSLPETLQLLKPKNSGMCPPSTTADRNTMEKAPPLPLPRRNHLGSKSHSIVYAATPNTYQDLEIPPMPPRRPPPLRSKSTNLDDVTAKDGAYYEKPPALPSRTSQSFVIKRPQLTTPVNTGNGTLQASAASSSIETRNNHEAGASSNSGLSRKMLLDRAHSLHTVVSLKQTQAEILQSEISMSSMALTLTQKSGHGLALVDWNGLPCVVGWNQRDFPSLHGKLHLGDQLISVNGVKVHTVEIAQKLLRFASAPKITVMLHRMPFAKVFAIRRAAEGQSLGIKREGGTGEIVYVDPNGLTAQHGLTPYAKGVTSEARCNWFITEINHRPVSLFFKENEIEHRLSAVGREISIVVQPSDFIHELRRQFKKLKNYKNFIAQ